MQLQGNWSPTHGALSTENTSTVSISMWNSVEGVETLRLVKVKKNQILDKIMIFYAILSSVQTKIDSYWIFVSDIINFHDAFPVILTAQSEIPTFRLANIYTPIHRSV